MQRLSRLIMVLIVVFFTAGCAGPEPQQEAPENSGWQAQQIVLEQDESEARAPGGQEGQQEKTGARDVEKQREQQQPSGKQQNDKISSSEQEAILGLLPATVTYVVDGDTVHVTLIDGKKEKVRFIGINTPESTREIEPYGKKAAAYTQSRLDGRKVWLELDVQKRDRYGRLLAYIWLEKPANDSEKEVQAKMFNAELLLNGYAQLMTVPPNIKYVDYFKEYQREAREAGRGLWGLSAKDTEDYYVASKRSNKFHRPDCEWGQKIAPYNLIKFNSRDEAIKAGYEPCRVCRP